MNTIIPTLIKRIQNVLVQMPTMFCLDSPPTAMRNATEKRIKDRTTQDDKHMRLGT